MASFNKVVLVGNLTRDPELRYTPKGTAICKIGMAINRNWRNEAGEQKEDVTFVDVECWGKQGATISQYLKKGRPILVEGRLQLDQWEDKETQQKKSRLGVVMESFQFLDSGGDGAQREKAPAARQEPRAARPAQPAQRPVDNESQQVEDDDVPF